MVIGFIYGFGLIFLVVLGVVALVLATKRDERRWVRGFLAFTEDCPPGCGLTTREERISILRDHYSRRWCRRYLDPVAGPPDA